ncbi:MAG: dihydropteroate synthase [Acidobacteria bacterium]|nr:dihydropteroate synthase [Acidobacteriota bacterium]
MAAPHPRSVSPISRCRDTPGSNVSSVFQRRPHRYRARDRVIELGAVTRIMGILNVTPDSFYDGGRFLDPSAAAAQARRIAEAGADILDIGAQSTRPGSIGISAEEELSRIVPVLEALGDDYPLPVSIDTSKAEVARKALERGASIINDVTSLQNDPEVGKLVAESGAGIVLMHMRGTPATMQQMPPSPDIMQELEEWVKVAVERAKRCGISCDRIMIDPGIGFGKSAEQNIEILRNLDRLAAFGLPILVGTSRKSFIGMILKKSAADRIWGTGATVAASIMFGAHVVRVHDVAEMKDISRVTDAMLAGRLLE